MDYEFLRDITGVVKVRMSMDHEAIGHWFNEEVKGNLALLDEVEQAARTVKGSERSWQRAGHEYTLWLDGEEVLWSSFFGHADQMVGLCTGGQLGGRAGQRFVLCG